MKTKIFLLAALIFGSTMVFSQSVDDGHKGECEKKVLNKIKRSLLRSDFLDHLDEGEKQTLYITCTLNEDNVVEVVKLDGYHEELKDVVISTLGDYPVKCDPEMANGEFTFKITFEKRPA